MTTAYQVIDLLAASRPQHSSLLLLPGPFESLIGRTRYRWVSDIPLVEMPQSVSVISRDMIDLLNWTSLNESVRYSAGATGEAEKKRLQLILSMMRHQHQISWKQDALNGRIACMSRRFF
mgnify:CR=1 FL=1